MKRLQNATRALLGCAFLLGIAGVAQSTLWNLTANFSTASNPNGAWSYGSTTTLGNISLYTNNMFVTEHYQGLGFPDFNGWAHEGGAFPFVARNDSLVPLFDWLPGEVL
ncbi:MAG: hypothetical protein H0W86_13600, partial [Armatimonadetes bacterium]|nr:hypothetical protein [Armatimonadota bacterium]